MKSNLREEIENLPRKNIKINFKTIKNKKKYEKELEKIIREYKCYSK